MRTTIALALLAVAPFASASVCKTWVPQPHDVEHPSGLLRDEARIRPLAERIKDLHARQWTARYVVQDDLRNGVITREQSDAAHARINAAFPIYVINYDSDCALHPIGDGTMVNLSESWDLTDQSRPQMGYLRVEAVEMHYFLERYQARPALLARIETLLGVADSVASFRESPIEREASRLREAERQRIAEKRLADRRGERGPWD
jgi:hypothetical protein